MLLRIKRYQYHMDKKGNKKNPKLHGSASLRKTHYDKSLLEDSRI
jgi:hypothetical protein